MFYAHIILAKKGPLARIWLAAHWDKKITKAHVFETNIEKSVEGIMQPKVKLALRTSGHLLLGVVRIYSRKAKYLLADCNEAFVKIKMAFRPGMVDLPEGHREANVNAITLPEVFHDFDTALPELNDIDIEAQFSINQSRADEITLREDYGSLPLSLHDDGFGDMGFDGDTPDMVREHLNDSLNDKLFHTKDGVHSAENLDSNLKDLDADITNSRLDADGFGDEFGQPELFGDELFGEPPRLETETSELREHIPSTADDTDDDASDHFDTRAPSPPFTCQESPLESHNEGELRKDDNDDLDQLHKVSDQTDQTVQNECESFALAPVDASAYKGLTKTKRKRKLIVDEIKNISGEEMKAQLANTADIVTTLDLAPPTKRLMYWKETGGVEKLFSLPSRMIPARSLFVNYQRHLISHFAPLEDFTSLGPSDVLALEQHNEADLSVIINKRSGRKRKLDVTNVVSHSQLSGDGHSTLPGPEEIREQNSFAIGGDSININMNNPLAESGFLESCANSGALFSINEMTGIDNLNSMTHLPFESGHLHHVMDVSDDCNNGDMTPANLHHGQSSPQHPEIESIESIPNLPVDQVSSILNEAENMPQTSNTVDLVSDWNDYNFPNCIEFDNNFDEQLENETSEQFEERVLNKRAAQLFYAVKTRMAKQDCLILSHLTIRNTRKQAAQKFYSLLVLKKFRVLNISQSAPYSDIMVSRGPLFENPKL